MALELVGGAVLGAVVGELFKVILDLGERAINFSPVLKNISFKLKAIIPLVNQIDELNEFLDYPKEETEKLRDLMDEGRRLLLQCGDVKLGNLDYLKKPFYTKKLRDLDTELRSFMDVLMLQMSRDQKRNLKSMNQLMEILCRIDSRGGSSKPVDFIVSPCLVPQLQEETVGLEKPVKELKVKILKNEVRMLVVTAPGGCGKTTLALKFCHDKEVKDIFQGKIIFVAVSRKPDLKLIMKNIIESLRGIQLPAWQSDEHAFCYLELWLKQTSQKPILIVLDDVWNGLESECLLDKLSQMPCCKILVTSRFSFPRFSESYYLEPLNHENAMKLFRRSASLDNGSSKLPDEETLEKVIGGCKRLPLALKVIGRSLSRRPTSVWRVTGRNLCRSGSIFDSEKELLECLQSSLDVLDDKMVTKESFMDLGSFPEDQRIPASTFIDIFTILYGEDENEAMVTLHELSSRSLLNSATTRKYDDEFYEEQFFSQHDSLRDLAIYLMNIEPIEQRKRLFLEMNGNDFPKWWVEQEKHPSNARLISITTDERFSSSWPDMEAPKVEVLILNLQSRTYNLPGFIKRMNNLKALIITNFGCFLTEVTSEDNQPFNCLQNLERIRFERISVPRFRNNQNLKPLRNLQKISFVMCKFGKTFINISSQISELLSNLVEISIDLCNDLSAIPNGVCDIVKLQKLSITNCHGLTSLPEDLGKLINLKMLRIRCCIYLAELPESTTKLRELVHLDISHCLDLVKLPEKMGELHRLEKLDMRHCTSLRKLPSSIRNLKNLTLLCDGDIAEWLKMVAPRLGKQVKVQEEEANLDWLCL
ncbi:probable disease resistance protein At5g66900 isoform X1 [Cucurbita moschata]|uniref:Probable disease resistance protein At5g66900 isoform X1 n=1 Tax=Cucurbita moschata TaxID=3662 RepID=A0A6J1HH39_CUCMO|nr:probable disease resistance protein At5g66900 isoform X1 [Cucurbita moschata]